MLPSIYKLATQVFAKSAPRYLANRAKRGKEEPDRLDERYGIASLERPQGRLIWIHAASVGEARSILSLTNLLLNRHKDWSVLVTTGTVTSARTLNAELPARAYHQFIPLDVPQWVNRFLDHWRPDMIVWVEQELWPNMLKAIHDRSIPAILANGRLTAATLKNWRWIKGWAKDLLTPFHSIYAQSVNDGARYQELADREVLTNGNLKYASQPLSCTNAKLELIKHVVGDRPLWLAASTHLGEEAILAEAQHIILDSIPNALMIIVPRHPERAPLICQGLDKLNITYALRSQDQEILPSTRAYVADTLGELGAFYRLCPIAFVGGSLVPIGGHNLIEPAQLGCAPIYGPYMENFEEIKQDFESVGAGFQVKNAQELARTVLDFMTDADKIKAISALTKNLIAKKGQVLDDLVADIETVLR